MNEDYDFDEPPARNENPEMKHCFECGQRIRMRAEICPHCGVRQPRLERRGDYRDDRDEEFRRAAGNRIAAGICAILLGYLGVHKFILGMTTPGVIMVCVSVLTCGVGVFPMWVIGIVEGIIYLTKTDEEFYEIYVLDKKEWF